MIVGVVHEGGWVGVFFVGRVAVGFGLVLKYLYIQAEDLVSDVKLSMGKKKHGLVGLE